MDHQEALLEHSPRKPNERPGFRETATFEKKEKEEEKRRKEKREKFEQKALDGASGQASKKEKSKLDREGWEKIPFTAGNEVLATRRHE